jgi:hypothetical protein
MDKVTLAGKMQKVMLYQLDKDLENFRKYVFQDATTANS